MKLTVIGGGGVRSMFLAKSIAQRAEKLGITELVLMDNREDKLYTFGKMAKHVANILCPSLIVTLTSDAQEAVYNADYVITTIRVGGDEMRVLEERIALSMGLLGQETTGASGFSFAMRSIPALVEYCELIRTFAKPNVKVFNFTNPAGLVSQALRDLGYDFCYGVCDAPSGLQHQIADVLGCKSNELTTRIFGLNHLSFFSSVRYKDKELIKEIIDSDKFYEKTDMRFFDKKTLRFFNCILNEYLYYFLKPKEAVTNIIASPHTRAETILGINQKLLNALGKLDIDRDFEEALRLFDYYYGQRESSYMANETGIARKNFVYHFDMFSEDAGGYAGVALRYIEITQNKTPADMILCVPNGNAIPFLRPDDVVEISCRIDDKTIIPYKAENIPDNIAELISRVKYYERTAAKAINKRDISEGINALSLHPLVASFSQGEELLQKFIELNKEYTGKWN